MKLILSLLAIVALLSFTGTSSPLSNTKWSGGGLTLFFTTSDTLKISVDGEEIAQSIYAATDSIFTMRDLPGYEMSCDASITGSYDYQINKDQLSFKLRSDSCEERGAALERLVLTRDK